MLHIQARDAAGARLADATLDHLPALLAQDGALVWLDLDDASADELAAVVALLGWEPLLAEDLANGGQRAKLEAFDSCAYLVMHALMYEGSPPRLSTPEVDFVIGANYIISAHREPVTALTDCREEPRLGARVLRHGPDYLLYELADRLVDSYFPVLDAMHDAVDDLEDAIVSNPTNALMGRIFDMKHDAVLLRKTLGPQRDLFSRLSAPDFAIVTETNMLAFRDVHDHLIRVADSVDGYRELMSGSLDAYLSTVSNRMNEVMKRLTVMAALFLPITFFTGIFGMNLRVQPLWHDAIFWVFLAAMLAVSVGQWWYFRRKGWA